jgi:hypothetical protein
MTQAFLLSRYRLPLKRDWLRTASTQMKLKVLCRFKKQKSSTLLVSQITIGRSNSTSILAEKRRKEIRRKWMKI